VQGNSDSGDGVRGVSVSGFGVRGFSDMGTAVFSLGGRDEGVQGRSGSTASSASGTRVGVHGVTDAAVEPAMWGENVAGGAGVLASGPKVALQVQGPAVFDRSGVVTVAAGHSTAKETGIALTAASLVLATMQGNVAGVYVQGVTLVTGSPGSFTIHLNKGRAPERQGGLVRHQLSPS
jgi:hypothetical protein